MGKLIGEGIPTRKSPQEWRIERQVAWALEVCSSCGAEARSKGQKSPTPIFFSDFGHFILEIEEKTKTNNKKVWKKFLYHVQAGGAADPPTPGFLCPWQVAY